MAIVRARNAAVPCSKPRALAFLLPVCLLVAATARAEERPTSGKALPPAKPRYSPWQSSRATPFVSLASDAGFIYARPRLTVGYGAPFWNFVGVEAAVLTTNSFGQPSIGWRASLPFLDAILSAREVFPYNRRFMAPKDSHSSGDLRLDTGGRRSVYHAVDLEVALTAPVLHGGLFLQAHPLFVDAPRDLHLYEEEVRAIMVPPFALATRGGYVYGVGSGSMKFGGMVEYVVLPGRPKNVTRLGPIALVTFSKYLDGFAAFSFVVSSPDSLDIQDGTYAFVGVLHRWAQRF